MLETSITSLGWFRCRFGAHDFHSNNDQEFDQSVSAGTEVPPSLTHEAIIVEGGSISFFRNGERQGNAMVRPSTAWPCIRVVVLAGMGGGADGGELADVTPSNHRLSRTGATRARRRRFAAVGALVLSSRSPGMSSNVLAQLIETGLAGCF